MAEPYVNVQVNGSNLKFTPITLVDNAVGNNKTFIVPANKEYLLEAIDLLVTTTATVGERRLQLVISDGTNTIYIGRAIDTVAAGQTGKHAQFIPGVVRETSFDAVGSILVPLPKILLKENYTLKLYDGNAIDTLDTYGVTIAVSERSV